MAVQVVGSRLQVVEGSQRPQRVTNWRDALSGTEDYSDVMYVWSVEAHLAIAFEVLDC